MPTFSFVHGLTRNAEYEVGRFGSLCGGLLQRGT